MARPRKNSDEIALAQIQGSSLHFACPQDAYEHLERRGYRLTRNDNWLLPADREQPTPLEQEAVMLLSHVSDYGPVVKMRSCPFCGGKADPFSPIGVECLDCGGNAPDVETWQRRTL
jgi:hypothetical protein